MSSPLIAATVQGVDSHVWLMDAILNSAQHSIITESSFGQKWLRVKGLTVN